MAVPIRDAQGNVIGALGGATDVRQSSFLDRMISNSYGKSEGYAVLAPKHHLIITATDKKHVLETVPAPDTSPELGHLTNGFECSAVLSTPDGKMLASAKCIATQAG